MRLTNRLVPHNQTIFAQADFFESDGVTRVMGLSSALLDVQVFYQNVLQAWVCVDGTGVTDSQVSSGRVYWGELPTSPGFYGVRWRPNALGFWRVVLSYQTQDIIHEYDVLGSTPDQSLAASFLKPSC